MRQPQQASTHPRLNDGRNRLLVGYDRHPASQQAVLVAARLAEALDAHLTVAHVVDLEDYPVDPDRADWEEAAEEQVAADQDAATSLLSDKPIRWRYHTARGRPADVLSRLASDLDVMFIVVGATEKNLIRRFVDGSVPKALAAHQPKPILVVPGPRHTR